MPPQQDNPDPHSIKSAILKMAGEEGFDVARVTGPRLPDRHGEGLARFVELDRHGTMNWLETRQEQRRSPNGLWPDVQSVIMLGLNYGPDHDPREVLQARDRALISVYARGDDYHDVIKKRLKAIGRAMAQRFGAALKVFVDTAPVMEKPLAAQAGLGWQGKHTNLVSREFGSWLFLGAIYTDLALPADTEEIDHCGSCRACLDACPTRAFPSPYQIDARRCLSYLTIEHKGPWPEDLRGQMGNRIYGCDDCLAACPWNKFAQEGRNAKLAAREMLKAPKLADLLVLDDPAFRALFSKSPIKRIGLKRFLRNCLYAAGNSGDPSLLDAVNALTDDDDPVVADAAKWALVRLEATGGVNAQD